MDIYLIDSDGNKFQFPVNPPQIQIQREKQYETVNIMRLGEIDFPQAEKIKEISFSSFLPAYDSGDPFPSYCRYPLPSDWNPQIVMNQINDMMLSKKPLRLIISDTAVNVLVFVSTHNSSFMGGEVGDIYFDLTCRTYREVKVRTTSEDVQQSVLTDNRPDTKATPTTYSVKTSDTLYKIAKLVLGDGGRWRDIYNLNQSVIGSDPNTIQVGQELVMPT